MHIWESGNHPLLCTAQNGNYHLLCAAQNGNSHRKIVVGRGLTCCVHSTVRYHARQKCKNSNKYKFWSHIFGYPGPISIPQERAQTFLVYFNFSPILFFIILVLYSHTSLILHSFFFVLFPLHSLPRFFFPYSCLLFIFLFFFFFFPFSFTFSFFFLYRCHYSVSF